MSPYNPDKCVTVPTDSRLWIAAIWTASLILMVVDSLDLDPSFLAIWSVFLALAGASWLCATLHAYSRRVILEVMSWEHQQQGFSPETRTLAALRD